MGEGIIALPSRLKVWELSGVEGSHWGVNRMGFLYGFLYLFSFIDGAWFAQEVKSMKDISYSRSHLR